MTTTSTADAYFKHIHQAFLAIVSLQVGPIPMRFKSDTLDLIYYVHGTLCCKSNSPKLFDFPLHPTITDTTPPGFAP